MTTVIEKKEVRRRGDDKSSVPEERRCTHVYADGRRCKQRRWREKEVCFHHDPEAAELRKAQPPSSELRLISKTEVHSLLADVINDLRTKRMKPGEAYAIGYLVQLLLGNYNRMADEYDRVKSNWERWQEIGWRLLALDDGKYEERVLGQTSEDEGEEEAEGESDQEDNPGEAGREG
jgi:hypothetical protein